MIAWVKRVHEGFESSTGPTEEFNAFYKQAQNWFKKFAKANGFTHLEMHKNHFEFSGFMTSPKGQVWYFNSGDVRFLLMDSLLVRKAKHYRDFCGEVNRFVGYDESFEDLLTRLVKD